MRYLGPQAIEDIAMGSAVLGTGGGGDPYLGKLAALQAFERYGPLALATVDDLPPETMTVCPFAIGAPVAFLERITILDELEHAFRVLTRFLGATPGALVSAEIGGVNSVVPLALGARLGLPVLDADGMGRAYPQIQLKTFTLHGHQAAPLAIADEHGNVVLIEAIDNAWAERLARPAATVMGAIAGGCYFPMTVADIKTSAVLGSVSYAEAIGAAIRTARATGRTPIAAVLAATQGFRMFEGRISDVRRRLERGWNLGDATIAGTGEYAGRELRINFQNEHLVAIEDGEVVASVPDLIAILDSEHGEPVTTEHLRYGFRVTVAGIPCDPQWRTAAGIALGGPRHFGYDVEFVPVEARFGSVA